MSDGGHYQLKLRLSPSLLRHTRAQLPKGLHSVCACCVYASQTRLDSACMQRVSVCVQRQNEPGANRGTRCCTRPSLCAAPSCAAVLAPRLLLPLSMLSGTQTVEWVGGSEQHRETQARNNPRHPQKPPTQLTGDQTHSTYVQLDTHCTLTCVVHVWSSWTRRSWWPCPARFPPVCASWLN